MVEAAQRSRDSDIPSYVDELHELAHPDDADSVTFSSSSDENTPSTSERCRKPRRVRTYHGTEDAQQGTGSGSNAYSAEGSVRRHTTVPQMPDDCTTSSSATCSPAAAAALDRQVDQELRRWPLKGSVKSRRAATELIKENVRLRLENDQLRDENAL